MKTVKLSVYIYATLVLILIGSMYYVTVKKLEINTTNLASDISKFVSTSHTFGELSVNDTYTGTVTIDGPIALGVLDISLTLIDGGDGTLAGKLHAAQSLAFPTTSELSGTLDMTTNVTPTFTLASNPITSTVSGREITRVFTFEGELHDNGDVIEGAYRETIEGFTPKPLMVSGRFLASRPAPLVFVASVLTATPTPSATPTGMLTPTATVQPVTGTSTPLPTTTATSEPSIGTMTPTPSPTLISTPTATATPNNTGNNPSSGDDTDIFLPYTSK